VEISGGALAVARQKFARPNTTWIEEDCVSLARAGELGPYDCIVNFENLEHVGDPERFVDRVVSLLAPGGVFLVSTPNRLAMNRMHGAPSGSPTANPFHALEFSAAELEALLSRRFAQVTISHQTLVPAERFLYEPVLDLLWSNPFVRAGRWVQRVLRGRRIAERVEDLLPARTYQIVHSDPGFHLAITTLAECRGPWPTGP
jgi:SAM-dependent methyltransferase